MWKSLDRWLSSRFELETNESRRARRAKWDYEQTNDLDIFAADPLRDAAADAADLLETDPETAFPKLLDLANRGSVWCMNFVVHCYKAGLGVSADPDKALEWCRRAFEAGSTRGLLNYGPALLEKRHFEAAEEVFAVGAAQDWAPALRYLAITRLRRSNARKTLSEIRPLLDRAAAKGSPLAQQMIARETALGRFGLRAVPKGWCLLWDFVRRSSEEWPAERCPDQPLEKVN